MLIRYLLLLSWIPALGLTHCVNKVSDCQRAQRYCYHPTVGKSVRANCARMCGNCSNSPLRKPSKKPSRKPSKKPARKPFKKPARKPNGKTCVDNKQCHKWKQQGFCKSHRHTEATKRWLCPKLCFHCKPPTPTAKKPKKPKSVHPQPRPRQSTRKPLTSTSKRPIITTKRPTTTIPRKPQNVRPTTPKPNIPANTTGSVHVTTLPADSNVKVTTLPPEYHTTLNLPEHHTTTLAPEHHTTTLAPKHHTTTLLPEHHTTTNLQDQHTTTLASEHHTTILSDTTTLAPEHHTTTLLPEHHTTILSDTTTLASEHQTTTELTTEASDIKTAQFKRSIDTSVDPCGDFYKFACGNYEKEHPVNSPEDNFNLFRTTQLEVRKRQVELISENSATTSSAIQKMRQFRDVCKNNPIAQTETKNLWKEIEAMGSASILKDGWKKLNKGKFTEAITELTRHTSKYYLFDLSVKKISSTAVRLFFHPVPLIYPNPSKYDDPKYTSEVDALKTYIKDVLTLLLNDNGGADKRLNLEKDVQTVVEFDRQLSKLYVANNYTSVENMIANSKKTKLSAFFDSISLDYAYTLQFDPFFSEVKSYLASDPEIYVYTPNFFKSIVADMYENDTTASNFVSHLVVRVILDQARYLDSRFDELHQKFAQATGNEDEALKSDKCVEESIAQFPLVNDFLYNQRYLKADEIEALKIFDTRKAIVELLNTTTDYERASRNKAIEKVNAMKEIMGGVPQARDEKLLDQEYAQVVIDAKDTYRLMVVKLTAETKKRRLRSITRSQSVTAFVDFRSTDINLHQIYFENQFYIPAAIIQSPYFNKDIDYPAVLNFGSFAWLRSRQILHSVDNTGIHFDAAGEQNSWMTPFGQRVYGNRIHSLRGVYEVQIEEKSGRKLNSYKTLNSDIVDHAAIRAVFRAYKSYREANPTNGTVPGYDQYSPEEQLFISFGTMMCSSQGAKYLDRHVLDKTRSPPKNLVNTVLRSYNEFANVFKCPQGSPMNPRYRPAVWGEVTQ